MVEGTCVLDAFPLLSSPGYTKHKNGITDHLKLDLLPAATMKNFLSIFIFPISFLNIKKNNIWSDTNLMTSCCFVGGKMILQYDINRDVYGLQIHCGRLAHTWVHKYEALILLFFLLNLV